MNSCKNKYCSDCEICCQWYRLSSVCVKVASEVMGNQMLIGMFVKQSKMSVKSVINRQKTVKSIGTKLFSLLVCYFCNNLKKIFIDCFLIN